MIKKTFKDFILLMESSKYDENVFNILEEKTKINLLNSGYDEKFFTKFNEFISYISVGSPSWNRLSKNGSRFNSESIWLEIKDGLSEFGLTWINIQYNRKFILKNISAYSSMNAYVDIIMYQFDNKYKVGGFSEDMCDDFDEISIKYNYGFHQTTYGRLMIKLYWGSMEKFFKQVLDNIYKIFLEKSIIRDYLLNNDTDYLLKQIKDEDALLVEWNDGVSKIFLENFYISINSYLISNLKGDYLKFKSFFLNWIDKTLDYDDIQDESSYIIVDFTNSF